MTLVSYLFLFICAIVILIELHRLDLSQIHIHIFVNDHKKIVGPFRPPPNCINFAFEATCSDHVFRIHRVDMYFACIVTL